LTVLIDTSAWIEFLRATDSAIDRRVAEIVGREPYAITDAVVAELLAGVRSDAVARKIRGIADSGRFFPIRPLFDYESAADIARTCRRSGVTVPLVDCLIAAVAINNDLELLAADRDFIELAQHTPLRLMATA
jgi:predicted nucleic acid-binding protein